MLALLACTGDEGPPPPPTESDTGTIDDGIVHDPLSMPAAPTLDPADFRSAQQCQVCHPDQYAEWRTSMHAYAVVDPVFQRLVQIRQDDLAGTEDKFCMQCHTAIGTRGGEIVAGFSFAELSPIASEGITCEACHKVSEIARDHNSGHVLDPGGPMRGPLTDPAGNSFHASEGSEIFGTSAFCGACHDVIETSGLDLERPYAEWLESPSAAQEQTCQDCHMPRVERPAATGAAPRQVRQHRFVGVDVPLIDGWITTEEEEDLRASIRALLANAASLQLGAPDSVPAGQTFDVTLTVTNEIPAHNLPTGSTFLRQVWVELIARDADGTVLFVTGDLDANGDLRDAWSDLDRYGDPDLITLHSGFVDAAGNPELFSWRASEHASNAISPGYDRTWTLFVPTEGAAAGPITVEARLRFRALPPYLLRRLDLGDVVAKLDVYDLAADTVTVEVR